MSDKLFHEIADIFEQELKQHKNLMEYVREAEALANEMTEVVDCEYGEELYLERYNALVGGLLTTFAKSDAPLSVNDALDRYRKDKKLKRKVSELLKNSIINQGRTEDQAQKGVDMSLKMIDEKDAKYWIKEISTTNKEDLKEYKNKFNLNIQKLYANVEDEKLQNVLSAEDFVNNIIEEAIDEIKKTFDFELPNENLKQIKKEMIGKIHLIKQEKFQNELLKSVLKGAEDQAKMLMDKYGAKTLDELAEEMEEKLLLAVGEAEKEEMALDPYVVFQTIDKDPQGGVFIKNIGIGLKKYSETINKGMEEAEAYVGTGLFGLKTPGKKGRNTKILKAKEATIAFIITEAFIAALSSLIPKEKEEEELKKAQAALSKVIKKRGVKEEVKYRVDKYTAAVYEDIVSRQIDEEQEIYDEGIFSAIGSMIAKPFSFAKLRHTKKTKITDFAEAVSTPEVFKFYLGEILKNNKGIMKNVINNVLTKADLKSDVKLITKMPEKIEKGEIDFKNIKAAYKTIHKLISKPKHTKNIMIKILKALGVKISKGAALGTLAKQAMGTEEEPGTLDAAAANVRGKAAEIAKKGI